MCHLKKFTVLAAAVFITIGLSTTIPAAHAQPSGLPPIGAEIPASMYAANAPLTIQGATISLDFKGGIKVRVESNPNDPLRSVRLKVIGFRMEADLLDPLGDTPGEAGGVGKIIIEQNDIDVTPESLLRLTQDSPPKYENILVLRFSMTIDGGVQPDVLETKDPMVLVGHLTQYPPRGDLYRLQRPVELVSPDAPDVTVATIEKFPVQIAGL